MEHLKQSINKAVQSNHFTAIIFLDLDNFKNVNDNLGHAIGDLVLVEAAKRIKAAIKESDTVIRFGGDEFLIIIDNIDKLELSKKSVKKIHDIFQEPFRIQQYEIFITVSTGISIAPVDGTNPVELIRFADSAMYLSKSRGRNISHFFDPVIDQTIKNRFEIERELRKALENNEFEVHYQPFIDLKSGNTTGAEALIRWQNQKLGNVSPADFIHIAEQTGLIENIGEFVLRTACRQIKQWEPLLNASFQISINLSPRQFRNGAIVKIVKKILKEYDLSPSRIKFEITEGILLQSYDRPFEIMNELKATGISLAMDDFGTGYSSLQNLRIFSFDLLKIDQSFIFDMIQNTQARVMVEAIIAMSKSLGIDVIAEGIETKEQLKHLQQSGCNLGQGFLFSKAITATEFQKIIGRKFEI